MLEKFIISMFTIIFCAIISLAIMINGWGLTPHSWWWIIGGYLTHIFLSGIIQHILNKK
jgi:hypothetical protein